MVTLKHPRGWGLTPVLFLCLLLTSTVVPAEAYTDPGSGLLLWQLIVSGFVGCIALPFSENSQFHS
jgi:hypothetical protein